jgi:outer membrane protein assembly factor BamB
MRKIPIALVILVVYCSVTADVNDWPMFQHDPQHSGYSPSTMPASLRKVWAYEEYSTVGRYFIISEGKVFVAQNFSLSALDSNDGSVLWSIETPGKRILWSFPAVKNNKIYMSATEAVFCFDTTTGEVLWTYEVERVDLFSSPLIVEDHIIVGSGGQPWEPEAFENARKILCLNVESGEIVWYFKTKSMTTKSPAYFYGRVYINDGSGTIYCLDEQTGELLWERKIESGTNSSLSLDGERIFVGSHTGVACLDIETGELLWNFDCGEMIFYTPTVAYNKVFFGSPQGIFYCLDTESGNLVWKIETGTVISCLAVAASGKVAFGTGNGMLYMVDAESGESIESLNLGENGITALALSDGNLFVGQDNGKITCFEGLPSKKLILVLMIAVVMVSVLIWHQRK